MVRELCKYRFRAAFGVWALWCGGAPFGRFPSRLRRRGAHLGGGGAAVDKLPRVAARGGSAIGGQVRSTARGGVRLCPRPPPPCARHFAHQRAKCTAVDKLTREGRTGRGGDCLVHSAFALGDSAHKRRGRGRRRAGAGCGARRRPPLPSPFPTLRSATRGTGSQRRGLFPTAARTLPGSGRRANDILYIRVRRREDEHVLHRVASNDVDNFSVDNPLWITAAAGGRSLRGRRRRVCGGSVNDGAAGANVIQRKAKGYAEEM